MCRLTVGLPSLLMKQRKRILITHVWISGLGKGTWGWWLRWRVNQRSRWQKLVEQCVIPCKNHEQKYKKKVCVFLFLNLLFSKEIETLQYDSHKQRYFILIMFLCCLLQVELQPLDTHFVGEISCFFSEGFLLRRRGSNATTGSCHAPPQRRQKI